MRRSRRAVRTVLVAGGLAALAAACVPAPPPPPSPQPGAPTAVQVTANGAGSVQVSWTAPSYAGTSPITSYTVSYRRVANGSVGVAASGGVGPKIIGGADVSTATYPWVAALLQPGTSGFNDQFCGGSLIDASWVLTAAHCARAFGAPPNPANFQVALGHDSLTGITSTDRRAVNQVLVDPAFNASALTNDFALLHLSSPVIGGTPIPLVTKPADAGDGTSAEIIGWGCTGTLLDPGCGTKGGTYPDHLQGASISIVGNPGATATCGSYTTGVGGEYQPTSMLCAGPLAGGIDTCYGDSGGPLAIGGPNWELAGVTSFGHDVNCAVANYPGIYARVSSGVTWIESQLPNLGRLNVTVNGNPVPLTTPVTGLRSGDTYSFEVAAVNASGASVFSTPLDVVAP